MGKKILFVNIKVMKNVWRNQLVLKLFLDNENKIINSLCIIDNIIKHYI